MNYRFLGLAMLTALLMSIGQLMFKAGAQHWSTTSVPAAAWSFVTSGWLVGGVFLYAFTILIWIYTLQHLPLALCYPITALAYVIVPISSALLFREPVNGGTLIGAGLILAGITVIAQTWQGSS